MFNKKTLSLAVAAAATGLSLSANAVINVSDGTGSVIVANESVTPTTTGVLPIGVGDATESVGITGALGVGVSANDQIFVRLDWSSAVLNANAAAGNVTVNTTAATTVTGGLAGESSAIFGVLAPTGGFSQTDAVTFTIGTVGVSLAGSSSDVQMRIYEDQTTAIAGGSALSDQTNTAALSLANALSTTFTPVNATAEVTSNFTQYNLGGVPATLGNTGTFGSFTSAANTTMLLATGGTIGVLTDVVNTTTSTVTYTGDFSFATAAGAFFIGAAAGDCTTAVGTVLTPDTATLSTATATVAQANGLPLCSTVNGTTDVIPDADYTASVTLVHNVTTSSPATTVSEGSVGGAVRNGTTVEVAYLTTFDEYNQRLLINSRHGVAATYTVTFQTEAGVTATPLAAATGTLQPGENLVIRAADLVSLDGGTRCSATVTVVAPSGNISVATTQVNLADGATDTVSYN